MEVDFCVDRQVGRELDLLPLSNDAEGTFETGRPAGGKQLLRIGAGPLRTGRRNSDFELSVGTARRAVFAASGGVRLRGVDHLVSGAGDALLCESSHGHYP